MGDSRKGSRMGGGFGVRGRDSPYIESKGRGIRREGTWKSRVRGCDGRTC